MKILIVLLTQTKFDAIIVILALLIVAGIIGFVTAWLYLKSIHSKELKILQTKLEELQKQIVIINLENSNIKNSNHKKIEGLNSLSVENKATKSLYKKPENNVNPIIAQSTLAAQMIHDKDDSLIKIAQRKHMLNYKNIGVATVNEMDNLKMISGIGSFIEERLHALDIFTFRQISNLTANDINTINLALEYFSGRIERDQWVEQAKELLHGEEVRMKALERIKARKALIFFSRIGMAHKTEANDLTTISGIGGWIEEKLNALDIYTFQQIANFNTEDTQMVTEAIEYFPGRIERDEWILQAQELVKIAGRKAEILEKINHIKNSLSYHEVGSAVKHLANNLTLINGINLWVEERLNLLGIYTFTQISNLTSDDVTSLTEILGFSPNRVERAGWIKQARELKTMIAPIMQ